MIVHVAGRSEAAHFGDLSSPAAVALATRFWPGPDADRAAPSGIARSGRRRPRDDRSAGAGAPGRAGLAARGRRRSAWPPSRAEGQRFGRVSPTQAAPCRGRVRRRSRGARRRPCRVGSIGDRRLHPRAARAAAPGALDAWRRGLPRRCVAGAGDGAARARRDARGALRSAKAAALMDTAMLRAALSVLDAAEGAERPRGIFPHGAACPLPESRGSDARNGCRSAHERLGAARLRRPRREPDLGRGTAGGTGMGRRSRRLQRAAAAT